MGLRLTGKEKMGQSHMIFVQKMRMKREEHYSGYRAILRALGGRPGFLFFYFFGKFFQHVKKLLNFWNFVKIKVAKFKLNHLS